MGAHVPIEQQREHYRANPPSCLAALRCTVTDLPGYVFDGHGEPVNAIFAVACHTPAGVAVRVLQRILALTAAIWHNDKTGAAVLRSLTAYDH